MNREAVLMTVASQGMARRDARGVLCAILKAVRHRVFFCPVAIPLIVSLAMSLALIGRKYGLFGVSFLTTKTLGPGQFLVFLAVAAVMDLAIIQSLLVVWAVVSRLLNLSYRTYAVLFIAVVSATVIVANVMAYNVMSYLGDLVHIKAILEISDGWAGTLPYVLSWLTGNVPTILLALLTALLGFGFLWRLSRNIPVCRSVSPWREIKVLVALWVLAGASEAYLNQVGLDHPIAKNIRRTCLHQTVAAGLSWATDFDGDSRGWIDFPADFAPFDRRRHPFAREIPGNGIDENGIGGDLPAQLPVPTIQRPDPIQSTPDIIILVECSLRRDVIWDSQWGPSAMPRLRRMAEAGFYTDQAYSHNGYTTSSLKQILSGHLLTFSDSLIRDFKSFGYRVGVFSSDDNDFGNVRETCGLAEADYYFDASMDPESRLTTSTAPSSMYLPAARVVQEVARFLDESDPDKPIFAFIFLASVHFPYHLDCPKEIVPHVALTTRQMCPERRVDIIPMYRNAAANLDERIGELHDTLLRTRVSPSRGKPVTIVVGDHGESLFDDGMLGHGLVLNDVQTRVPLVIVNGWGRLPVPFGLNNIRPFLLNMLATPMPDQPVIVTHPSERPVFQYCGPYGLPLQIAHVSPHGRSLVDFNLGTFTRADGHRRLIHEAYEDEEFRSIIHNWESLRLTVDGR